MHLDGGGVGAAARREDNGATRRNISPVGAPLQAEGDNGATPGAGVRAPDSAKNLMRPALLAALIRSSADNMRSAVRTLPAQRE